MRANIFNFFIILILVFDMGGDLGIRPLAIILILISMVDVFFTNYKIILSNNIFCETIFLFFLFILWPTFLLLKSQANGFDLSISVSQISSLFFAFFYFLYRSLTPKISGLNNLVHSLFMLSLFYFLMLLVFLVNEKLFLNITSYFSDRGLYAGIRNENIALPNIYIKSSLFIFFAFISLLDRRPIGSIIVYVGSIITTSKMLFILNSVFLFLRMRLRNRFFLLFLISPIIVFLFFKDVTEVLSYLSSAFDSRSVTTSKRISDFYSIISLFYSDEVSFLFGFGPGSVMYSHYSNADVVNLELDHLNTIRKFGLVWFVIFLGYFLRVALHLYKTSKYAGLIGLVGVFILSGINPVLISPVFFIVLFECRFVNSQIKYNS
ncbi:hypothetical protein [Aeromonas caviae]|uniref:hypothetical protein n=1 Tax=Aeromonas caviae TaxID=648 RepID=UPI001FC8B19D|nr:hypothetical protein [Aeromonas caviae]